MNRDELQQAWQDGTPLDAAVEQGEADNFTVRFLEGGAVRALLLARHERDEVWFLDFNDTAGEPNQLSGRIVAGMAAFYRGQGFEAFRIPRAKGEAAALFERIGFEEDGDSLVVPLTAAARRANAYLKEHE